MLPNIEYAVNIIVGVVYNEQFRWYVTEKEFWFLDLGKHLQAFLDAGYSLEGVEDYAADRFNIAILNEETAKEFLTKIKKYCVITNELKQIISKQEPVADLDDVLEYFPSLLVDFDQKILKSQYPESASFEEYVPDGWQGIETNFLDDIPEEMRYWLIDGQDCFENWLKIPQRGFFFDEFPHPEAPQSQEPQPITQPTNLFTANDHKNFMASYYKICQEIFEPTTFRGASEKLKIMRREYLTRLPNYILARCPICGGRVWEPIDTFSLNGLGWNHPKTGNGWYGTTPVTINMSPKHRRITAMGETDSYSAECDHVQIVAVSLNLNGLQPDDVTVPYPISIGSEKPFVMEPVLKTKETFVVIHAIPVWRFYNKNPDSHYTAYFMTYFTENRSDFEHVMQPAYESYTSILYDWMDYDLHKGVFAGKVLWLDTNSPDLPLRRRDFKNFPYFKVKGGDSLWEIHQGQMKHHVGRSRKWSGGEVEPEWNTEGNFFQQLISAFKAGLRDLKK